MVHSSLTKIKKFRYHHIVGYPNSIAKLCKIRNYRAVLAEIYSLLILPGLYMQQHTGSHGSPIQDFDEMNSIVDGRSAKDHRV